VEAELANLCLQFEIKLYKQLREKLKQWVCLRELDLAATVSLRGYDVIPRIEFHEEENKKIHKGFVSEQVSINKAVKRIRVAVKWLMEKHRLWDYVLRASPTRTRYRV